MNNKKDIYFKFVINGLLKYYDLNFLYKANIFNNN